MSNQHEENAMGGYEPEQEATHSAYDEPLWEMTVSATSLELKQVGFTCERTQERHNFNSLDEFITAFLTVKSERDALASQHEVTEKELMAVMQKTRFSNSIDMLAGRVKTTAEADIQTARAILSLYTLVKKGA